MNCKRCKKHFHYCHNCGYDRELHHLSRGYCSEECLTDDDGEPYYEDDAGLELKPGFVERLQRQAKRVASGDRGTSLKDVLKEIDEDITNICEPARR